MDGPTIVKRFHELTSLRSTLDATLERIERYVVPYRGQMFRPETSEHEVEWRRRDIYDSTAAVAADHLAAFLHSLLTSPVVQWFKLAFRNQQLNTNAAAVQWLEAVEQRIWQAIQSSNFKNEMPEAYLDIVSFGTSVVFEEELSDDKWEGLSFTTFPIKGCHFEHGADEKVLRVYRELKYTKLQLEDKFPDYAFDESMSDDPDTKHSVIFCVYRRTEIKEAKRRMAPEARPWGYKYVLKDTADELEEGGYYHKPAMVARWKKVSGSRWGHSPAMVCLSDILQLNETVAMTSEARVKEIDPPMKTTQRGLIGDLDASAGGLTMVQDMEDLDRLLKPNPQLFQGDIEIERLQGSIRNAFMMDRIDVKESPVMTATEFLGRLERNQEKFAPTLARLMFDLLDPLIENTYDILARNAQLPEAPEGLDDMEMDIEYIGPIPRAMKSQEAQSTSMWLGEMINYGQVMPELMDTVNTEKVGRGLGLARGVPAAYMRSDDEIEQIRAERKAQQDAMFAMQRAQEAGKALKDMGGSGVDLQAVQ